MAVSHTANLKLREIEFNTLNWDTPLNENVQIADSISTIGGLAVTTAEVPSSSLNVSVAAGKWMKRDGTVGSFAAVPSLAVTQSATSKIYIDDSGVVNVEVSYPSDEPIVRLATVVTDATSVVSLTDDRVCLTMPRIQTSGASQVALTDSSTGTATSTIGDVGVAFDRAALNNIHASLAAKINMLRSELIAHGLIKGSV